MAKVGQFALDLKKFETKTNDQIRTIIRRVALDAGTRIIMKTPVDEGRARNSWVPAVGAPSPWCPGHGENDPSGQGALTRLAAAVNAWDVTSGLSFFFVSNLVYIPVLEFGLYPIPGAGKTIGGFSKQAPRGMVRITMREFPQMVELAALTRK